MNTFNNAKNNEGKNLPEFPPAPAPDAGRPERIKYYILVGLILFTYFAPMFGLAPTPAVKVEVERTIKKEGAPAEELPKTEVQVFRVK